LIFPFRSRSWFFWKSKIGNLKLDEGRVAWIGAAAYDIGVEFSRTTGEITHHISPNVDTQRDLLIADLTKAGRK
jgi:LssY C-terminus